MTRILAATANLAKAREIREILQDFGVMVSELLDFPALPDCIEDGKTFSENARKKAFFYHRLTGMPTLGDDSGLVVHALDGAPGVMSARYAGETATDADRIAKLLSEMENRGPVSPSADFVCAVSFVLDGQERIAVQGRCTGEIIQPPRGTGGFGYDPVFLVPHLGKTFAELTSAEKHAISHRGRALVKFRAEFIQLFERQP